MLERAPDGDWPGAVRDGGTAHARRPSHRASRPAAGARRRDRRGGDPGARVRPLAARRGCVARRRARAGARPAPGSGRAPACRRVPGRWEFTHALLQEAAYKRILRAAGTRFTARWPTRSSGAFAEAASENPRSLHTTGPVRGASPRGRCTSGTRRGRVPWSGRPTSRPPSTSGAGWRRWTLRMTTPATTSSASSSYPSRGLAAGGTRLRGSGRRGRVCESEDGVRADAQLRPAGGGDPRASGCSSCCAAGTERRSSSRTKCSRSVSATIIRLTWPRGTSTSGSATCTSPTSISPASTSTPRSRATGGLNAPTRSTRHRGTRRSAPSPIVALVLWNLGYAEESRERSDLSLERAGASAARSRARRRGACAASCT